MSRTSKHALIAGLCVAAASIEGSPAWADAVTAWNETAETASAVAGGPPLRNRIMAMVHIAVHDALNAIDPRFEQYASTIAAEAGASPEAAIAAAAYRVLAATVPSQAPTVGLMGLNGSHGSHGSMGLIGLIEAQVRARRLTATAAAPRPTSCPRWIRSARTLRASRTVPAG